MLESGEEVVSGLGLTRPAERLLDLVASIEQGSLRLAVVGAVSRGKSTLVNALLGASHLSVDMEACTGVITQVVHGTNTNEVTVVKGGRKETLAWEEFLNTYRFTPEQQGSIQDRKKRLRCRQSWWRLITLCWNVSIHWVPKVFTL